MTSRLVILINDTHPANPSDWQLDFTFSVSGREMDKKEFTMAVWMGALLNNVGNETFQKLVQPYVDKYWDQVVHSVDPNGMLSKPVGPLL